MNAPVILDRRQMLKGSGALVVSFSLTSAYAQDQSVPAAAPPPPSPPGSLKTSPYLDSWIRIDADSSITVFTGKDELGQGFKTAFQQIAAEELDVPFASLRVVTADTKLTANEGYTSGSHSMQDSGTAIQNAAASRFAHKRRWNTRACAHRSAMSAFPGKRTWAGDQCMSVKGQ